MMTNGFFIFSIVSMIAIAVYSFICWLKDDKKNVDIDITEILDD
jgi:hypothetical protein